MIEITNAEQIIIEKLNECDDYISYSIKFENQEVFGVPLKYAVTSDDNAQIEMLKNYTFELFKKVEVASNINIFDGIGK